MEILRAGIASARSAADVGSLIRDVSQELRDGRLSEMDAGTLFEALDVRRAELRPASAGASLPPGLPGRTKATRPSIFPVKKYRPKPDTAAAVTLRRQLAFSGPMPPGLGAGYTVSELAVFRIVADETARIGVCMAYVDELAARAGVCRRTVQNARSKAERDGLIAVTERPKRGSLHDTNVMTIINTDWLAWIQKGKRPGLKGKEKNFAPHGQGSNPEPSTRLGAQERATEEVRAGTERLASEPSALADAALSEAGAMPETHAAVRFDERPEPVPVEVSELVQVAELEPDPAPVPTPTRIPSLPEPKSAPALRLGPGLACLSPRAAQLLADLRWADAKRVAGSAEGAPGEGRVGEAGSVLGGSSGYLGDLPSALEGHRQGLGPGATDPLLMSAGGRDCSGHDGGLVEPTSDPEGIDAGTGRTLEPRHARRSPRPGPWSGPSAGPKGRQDAGALGAVDASEGLGQAGSCPDRPAPGEGCQAVPADPRGAGGHRYPMPLRARPHGDGIRRARRLGSEASAGPDRIGPMGREANKLLRARGRRPASWRF